jgi:hypothetical protein
MVLDNETRALTEAEIDVVAGGRRVQKAKDEAIKELARELEQVSDGKGFGGASQLSS